MLINPLLSIFFLLYRIELLPIKYREISYTVTENANDITIAFVNGGVYFLPIWGNEFFRGLELPDIIGNNLTHVMRNTLTRFDPAKPAVKMTQTETLFYNESAQNATIVIPKAANLIIYI